MLDPLPIPCCPGPLDGSIRPPGSKSITNRALVCAALARGRSELTGVLESEDTRVMATALSALGFSLEPDWAAGTVGVEGSAGRLPAAQATVDCRASGTTMRFLSAVVSLGHGSYRLDGTPRMRQRPIGDLLEALRSLGIECRAESPGGCPPVVIEAQGLAGGEASIDSSLSSQFASGLALAAVCSRQGLALRFTGGLVSTPYLTMTRRIIEAFGAVCEVLDERHWRLPATGYQGRRFAVEPDASAASYFAAAAAIVGGRVRIEGLTRESLQGDVGFAEVLDRMGCTVRWEAADAARATEGAMIISRAVDQPLRGVDIDMNGISDTVPTLAAVALFAAGATRIRNVAHIRDKETDRIGDLVRELKRLGADVDEHADGLEIRPRALRGTAVKTYDDHRMAMSLALVGLRVPGVQIEDPGCVRKTFPDYWERLGRLTGLKELSTQPSGGSAGR
jgi:3-phosphoshikimate 1-carboxyvinyltransferase